MTRWCPTDKNNLIYWAAQRLFDECGHHLPGLKIRQENNIPMARGLGSSSACIVAGILGANRMLGNPLSEQDLIRLAAQIEGHPDNTTPGYFRGLGRIRHGRGNGSIASAYRFPTKSGLPSLSPRLN